MSDEKDITETTDYEKSLLYVQTSGEQSGKNDRSSG